jgi:hypothetical protein
VLASLPLLRPNLSKVQSATGLQLLPKVANCHFSDFNTYLLYADESSENDADDDYFDADEESEDETGSGTDLDAYPSDDDEEPAPAPPIRSVKAAHTSLKPSTPANRGAGICLVPNCGKPSFVDRGGVKAEYCSTRHRE